MVCFSPSPLIMLAKSDAVREDGAAMFELLKIGQAARVAPVMLLLPTASNVV